MTYRFFAVVILLCAAVSVPAQTLRIKKGPDARQVVLNKYDTNYEFHGGRMAVKNGETGKWGFINEQGDKVIDYEWDYKSFAYPRFGGGACLVCKSQRNAYGIPRDKWYVIDDFGGKLPLGYDVVDFAPYSRDGYAIVVKRINDTYSRLMYIDNGGREVFPALSRTVYTRDPECPSEVRPFADGMMAFYDSGKRRWGFVNGSGKIVYRAVFLDVQDFSEGLAAVKVADNGGRWGFVNTAGRMVIPPKFSIEPFPFRDGKASVEKRSGSVVMIDKTGTVVSPEFADIRNFYLGYAYSQQKGKPYLDIVDENFNVVRAQVNGVRLNASNRDGKRPIEFINGYTNWEGGFMLNPIGRRLSFDHRWGEEIDTRHRTEKIIHVKMNSLDGFIDYDGNVVFYFAEEEF